MIAAADLLAADFGIAAEVWSATSFAELARDAQAAERWNRLHPAEAPRTSHAETCLAGTRPVVAATDYVRAYPGLIAPYLEARMTILGTDGFGRSDTRSKLRKFFEVDRHSVVVAALDALARGGNVDRARVGEAIERYAVPADVPASWTC